MSKLSSLAKDSLRNTDITNHFDENDLYVTAFMTGFESAIKILKENATNRIEHLKQYEMMTERIYALKVYMDTIDDMLKEMK
jgi:hypothetical protein